MNYYACIFYDIKNQKQGKAELKDIYSRVNYMRQNFHGMVAVGTMNRDIHIMEMKTLIVLHSLHLQGGGSLNMVIFEDNFVYFSPQSNYLCKFNITQPPVQKNITFDNTCEEISLVKTTQT